MNTIYLQDTVYNIIQAHPEVKELLIELGFKPLGQPQMLQTVGRITSLAKGIRLIGADREKVIKTLTVNGYVVKETRDE